MMVMFTQPLREIVHTTAKFGEQLVKKSRGFSFSYLEEDIKDVRVGPREEDDGEEGADAAVEHRGPDLGQSLLDALVPAPCDLV